MKEQPAATSPSSKDRFPTGANGAYCTIGGESALDIARNVCGNAAATIAIGTCATFGGIPAAAPNPTGALGVADAVPGVKNLINLSACPANVENLTALLVYYLTFKRWPPLDHLRRPLFAYGKSIHDNCERRAHYDAGQYVEAWGDEGHRAGLLPLQDGLQGPGDVPELPERQVERRHQLADRLRPSLHRLLRAATSGIAMTPFYQHLTGVPGFGAGSNIDTIGALAVLGVGAAFAGHGLIQIMKRVGDKAEPHHAEDANEGA